jgi:hypothetical protein
LVLTQVLAPTSSVGPSTSRAHRAHQAALYGPAQSRAQRTHQAVLNARNQAVLYVRIKSLDAHQVYNI